MQIKNIKAAKQLVIKYRSFDIAKIRELRNNSSIMKTHSHNDWCDYPIIMERFSGFGRLNTCSLCLEIYNKTGHTDCNSCIYYAEDRHGSYRCQSKTYIDILSARTDEELVKAVHDRADYIEGLIKKYELHGDKE